MSAPPLAAPPLAIVIPSWNGAALLRRFLPSVHREAARLGAELIVSDDGSSDDSLAYLASLDPAPVVVAGAVNRGFSPAVNAGVAAARAPVVVLLNNDLELPPGALQPVLERFADPACFALTFRGLDLPGAAFATGGKLGRWRRGFWENWRNFDTPGESFMLVGGFCAFRREGFAALGGFDEIFAPYYSEDLDLSYRARKRGWRIEYCPAVEVLHLREASTSRHRGRFARAAIIERNRLLFHWRNLDAGRLAEHLLWAHLLLAQKLVTGNWAYLAGYGQALARLGRVRAFRRREQPHWRVRDGELAVGVPPGDIPAAGKLGRGCGV